MEIARNRNWRLTKSLLVVVGLWPFYQTYLQVLLRSVATISIISIVIPEIIKIISVWGDVNAVAECAPLLSLHLASMVKMLSYYFHLQQLKTILEDIQKDWRSNLSHVEMEIIQLYGRNNKSLTHAYACVIFGCTILALSAPLAPKILDYIAPRNVSQATVFLYSVEYFVDPDKYEAFFFIHAYLISPFPSLVTISFDTTYFHCVQHGCSMFAIIRHRMQIIADQTDVKIYGDAATDKKIYQLLTDCIKRHVITLQYCAKLESFYTFALLPVVIINIFALSVTGFHTLMTLNDPPEALRFGVYSCGLVVHMFLYNYTGQDLINHSESIEQYMYDIKWYNMSPKLKSFFILGMMRSNEVCKITAGKLYIFSVENFGKVMKLSLSYFTVLLSFQ